MKFRRGVKVLFSKPSLYMKEIIRRNKFGKGTWIANNTMINLSNVGHYVFIARNCVINSAQIGSYSSIAPGVQIGGMEHNYKGYTTCQHLSDKQVYGKKTVIGEDVWIGANCVIKQGVKIGRGAVIGACSFVTHDVEPYSVVYGIPARFIKYRFDQSVIDLLEKSKYWEYYPDEAKKLLNNMSQKEK